MSSSSLQPALENLDEALSRLEGQLEGKIQSSALNKKESKSHNGDVNKLIAKKLDSTIQRLETLLAETEEDKGDANG